MYKYEDIREVHLEVTERCQAGCAMCGRFNLDGTINKNLRMAELSLEDIIQIFPVEFIAQLENMFMCGNFGDPVVARDTLDIFEYFRYKNTKMHLTMHTNGGARPASWWRDLASLLYTSDSDVKFAIDGLEDTNHLYRENVSWAKVMSAAESYIAAGGSAVWVMLVFKHNEHQVEEAEALSKKMGFKRFVVKRSSRFRQDRKVFRHLEVPTQRKYVNDSVYFLDFVKEKYGSYSNFLASTEISCKVKNSKSLYVSAEGLVVPCCWLGYDMRKATIKKDSDSQMLSLADYNMDNLNAKTRSLRGVFDTGIFEEIENSWGLKSVEAGRLEMCAATCSSNYSFFEKMFQVTY